ncbi:MAG TPA: phosphotransferase family protein [Acidimicrobiales bacterium]|nr:phosphotransferase family protein [Acidimicrobiales bacterium]
MGDETVTGTPSEITELRRSSRDRAELTERLCAWLRSTLPPGSEPAISGVEGTSANGMSSETLLFDAAWTQDGAPIEHRLVARVAPGTEDVPVFPRYDLPAQFRAIQLVSELTDVPVPTVWWCEPDPAPLGAPFFVMSRVDGRVPPDVMPYNFGDSWLYDAAPDDQRHLQDATVDVLARLHAIDRPAERFPFLVPDAPGDTLLRRRVETTRAWYRFAATDGFTSPLVERAFAWLDEHWPSAEGEAVLSWGDSRIGNMMFDGFDPVAVLDWEMAGVGPRELDVAWLIYGHRIFEDIAAQMGLGGMPHFLRLDDVAGTYEALTGHSLVDLTWYTTYAALQYAIVFLRTGARSVHFGEVERPGATDDLIMNRDGLERMLAGTYWS